MKYKSEENAEDEKEDQRISVRIGWGLREWLKKVRSTSHVACPLQGSIVPIVSIFRENVQYDCATWTQSSASHETRRRHIIIIWPANYGRLVLMPGIIAEQMHFLGHAVSLHWGSIDRIKIKPVTLHGIIGALHYRYVFLSVESGGFAERSAKFFQSFKTRRFETRIILKISKKEGKRKDDLGKNHLLMKH